MKRSGKASKNHNKTDHSLSSESLLLRPLCEDERLAGVHNRDMHLLLDWNLHFLPGSKSIDEENSIFAVDLLSAADSTAT